MIWNEKCEQYNVGNFRVLFLYLAHHQRKLVEAETTIRFNHGTYWEVNYFKMIRYSVSAKVCVILHTILIGPMARKGIGTATADIANVG